MNAPSDSRTVAVGEKIRAFLDEHPELLHQLKVDRRRAGRLATECEEGVTLRTLESILIKAYRHSDKRGEMLRTEVRPPPVKATLREVELMLLDRRPLGRNSALERLTLQVQEDTKAALWSRREILHMRKAVDKREDRISHVLQSRRYAYA